jgi:hypothetical protein
MNTTVQTRRRRYSRHEDGPREALTARKIRMLQYVAEYGIVSLPQLARLACPSEKSARRHMRELFDAGLVHVIAVPRAALADPSAANEPGLAFGTAPNIYSVSRPGARAIEQLGLLEKVPVPTEYGPRNSLFLAHELEIRDVRVWLELAARARTGHELVTWRDGEEASFELRSTGFQREVRPDAWFLYKVAERMLVGMVEVDRGTERGLKRWQEKLASYLELFQSDRLKGRTGYQNARVLVIACDPRRRDRLADIIAEHAPETLAGRFWLTNREIYQQSDLHVVLWRTPKDPLLRPLIAPTLP